MGQTLTHGIYLPDEGERNCYNGLAANWQLLDGAVGTIAEHTSALSDKAPLVHTHTKADITDFPALATVATSGSYNDLNNIPASFTPASHSHGNLTNDGKIGTTANVPLITGTGGVVQAGSFGTSANTFCEGNDSRLSDARTPVAHTHTKSDVTNLFNSANTWTGDNTFTKNLTLQRVNAPTLTFKNSRVELGESNLSGDTYTQFSFEDKNSENFGYLRQTYGADGSNNFQLFVRNKFLNGVPDTTGTVDFSYFGLKLNPDKSKEAVLKASLRPYDSTFAYNLGDATYQWNNLYAKNYYYNGTAWGLDKANTWAGTNTYQREICINGDRNAYIAPMWEGAGSGIAFLSIDASKQFIFGQRTTDANNRSVYDATKGYLVFKTGVIGESNYVEATPHGSDTRLGDSTNKWKTLNGINPGALSLPDYTLAKMDLIDFSQWSVSGQRNEYTPISDGWLFVNIKDTASNSIFIYAHGLYNADPTKATDYSASCFGNGSQGVTGRVAVMIPVRAGITYGIFIKAASVSEIYSAKFYPALGNV